MNHEFIEKLLTNNNLTTHTYLRELKSIEEFFVNNPEQINEKDNNGRTYLMILCKFARSKGVEDLIQKLLNLNPNLDLNVQDNKGNTALMLASLYCNQLSTDNTIKMLINAGCNLNLQNFYKDSALTLCIGYQEQDTVKILIDAGCDLNTLNLCDSTPLIICCIYSRYVQYKSIDVTIKLLIDAGCDLNIQNKDGDTALMICCKYFKDNINIINMLLDAGCDINVVNTKKDYTALTVLQSFSVIELLLKYMIDYELSDINDKFLKLECSKLYEKFLGDQAVRKHIKKINSLQLIKFIPKRQNDVLWQPTSYKTKMLAYTFEVLNGKPLKEVFDSIDDKIKDYFCLSNYCLEKLIYIEH